jgi:hypothetical protein
MSGSTMTLTGPRRGGNWRLSPAARRGLVRTHGVTTYEYAHMLQAALAGLLPVILRTLMEFPSHVIPSLAAVATSGTLNVGGTSRRCHHMDIGKGITKSLLAESRAVNNRDTGEAWATDQSNERRVPPYSEVKTPALQNR